VSFQPKDRKNVFTSAPPSCPRDPPEKSKRDFMGQLSASDVPSVSVEEEIMQTGATVGSKVYRKVVNKLAGALGVSPRHTRYPSVDFVDLVADVDPKSRDRALKMYKLGLRRGFDVATTAVVEGNLVYQADELMCPDTFTIRAGVKFKGQPRETVEFTFTAEELGFSRE
jgi:hypothetical protein